MSELDRIHQAAKSWPSFGIDCVFVAAGCIATGLRVVLAAVASEGAWACERVLYILFDILVHIYIGHIALNIFLDLVGTLSNITLDIIGSVADLSKPFPKGSGHTRDIL